MKSTSRRWTDEEWARAEQLLTEGYAIKTVATMLGRTVREVCSKKQWMQMSADKRERKALQKQQRRAEQKEGVKINRAEFKIYVPEDAVADRNARVAADRSLTAFVFGDPPPGWSALDRRTA
jgi:predicted nucleotidyltransferase